MARTYDEEALVFIDSCPWPSTHDWFVTMTMTTGRSAPADEFRGGTLLRYR